MLESRVAYTMSKNWFSSSSVEGASNRSWYRLYREGSPSMQMDRCRSKKHRFSSGMSSLNPHPSSHLSDSFPQACSQR